MRGKLNKSSKTNTRVIKDIWRFKGDNHESTNKLNEFWTGKSTFKVLANAEVIGGDKHCKVSPGSNHALHQLQLT